MPVTPSAESPASRASGPAPELLKTQLIRPAYAAGLPQADTTDYELSASTLFPKTKSSFALPAIRFVEPNVPQDTAPLPKKTETLDAETRETFHKRLRLCCFVGAMPITLYFICAMMNFIEPFGKSVVGMTGAILAAVVLFGLISMAVALHVSEPFEANILRACELGIFGAMGLFFAYWQFVVQTSAQNFGGGEAVLTADVEEMKRRYGEVRVLAVTLVTHLNWVALIVFHGVLVPNSLIRGVAVVVSMLALALSIDAVTVAAGAHTPRTIAIVFTIATPSLVAAALFAIFGTAKTARLQEQVEEAKQMLREMGQYRLRKRLGSGGMGEVYLAEHHLLKRQCAIKRIHPKYLDNADQIRRFEREVQATARLRHPNTVEIYDYGRADDGTFYYVMEYLPGSSLEEMISRFGPMPADRILHVLKQICSALREAHRHQLIHRDIKPSNIILMHGSTPYDQVKLVDFGLVHSNNWAADPEAKLTRDGLIVGTPEYMSPEQAQGLALDARSDLFSVGSVAYFLLTGKEPFHRETAMKTLLAVVSDEPKPIREFNPFVPDDVAAIVMKCLAKEPENRIQSAHDLEMELSNCKHANDWTEEKAVQWWASHPESNPGTGTDLASLPLRADQSSHASDT